MDKEQKELYDAFKNEINKARHNTIKALRKENDKRVLKIDAKYSTMSINLGGNTLNTDLNPRIYEQQQANIRNEKQEEYDEIVRDGCNEEKNKFFQDALDNDPDKIEQFEKKIADDPDLQWLKDPKEKKVEQQKDEREELDTVVEEDEMHEGFPGDEEGDGTQNQEINRNQINLQTEFPGIDVGTSSDNSIQPDRNASNRNVGRKGPNMEPS